jgi:hypothetical protein
MGLLHRLLSVLALAAVCLAADGTPLLPPTTIPSSEIWLLDSKRCWSAIIGKQSTSYETDSAITPRIIAFAWNSDARSLRVHLVAFYISGKPKCE